MPEFEQLFYRGNFSLRRRWDASGFLLSAEYPGGYQETVIVGNTAGIRSWQLKYPALHNQAIISPPERQPESRLDYIFNFFLRSKQGGNVPFILTDPEDSKDYLCYFPEDFIELEKMDHRLSTTGLSIQQTYRRGVSFNLDGSVGGGEEPPNPDET